MQNVLIISGHPNLNESIGNATILLEVAKALPDAEIRFLDALYPDYQINVVQEQEALLNADVIVWQFPFSWYSVPGLMKLWIDQVFVHGFAHGSTARLGGKKLIISFTAGAPESLYSAEGLFGHDIQQYMTQFETTAAMCNLDLQGKVYTLGISYAGRDEAKTREQKIMAKDHATRLITAIKEIAPAVNMAV
ncbi:NAD(P)H-dependent oxidoreductase [Pectobacterium atrosepticum]|uniref:NAD(P)H-dependent oxidoreductase n=1 Tax=Pectobacterium atrosepticum TaxID=29471 RepID=UPI0005017188|nr:NAD(P)H-dependent oxidoreductase [Pectobacterium atrosepticum]GKV86654.1 NAD(P)H dehydrogenase [Pectobacterium carotovorum subsp. carotovorum]KFX17174.1 NAD(P)H dehydrogenase [Pectobacterium atrosepticum]KMK80996.1 putative NAD(P)H oxidoreductase [Pectobacterium atrosepticum ICMP 1526]MCL6391129.1 flavodoxin family protein [Pectobacterium atrosepticum]MDK9443778.1 NAD(P)H-dependent oxidoreductase [Pectobacterium atrosepticum]